MATKKKMNMKKIIEDRKKAIREQGVKVTDLKKRKK